MMQITLNQELENLIQSQLLQGKYSNVEELLKDALLSLLASKKRQALSQRVNKLFNQTQALPYLQDITDEDIAAEVDAYRSGIGCVVG
jgi:antitoxin ParD1/3/4